MGLYRLKPASQRLIRPIEDLLVAQRVDPDRLSAAAVVVAAVGGLCLALADRQPPLLLLVPFLAAARLILNLLDGMLARRTGVSRPRGELWNELGDRVGDTLFVGGLMFHPAVDPRLVAGAVVAALLASYAGIAARAAGGRRQYGGIMSKPGRMIVLAVAAPVAFLTADAVPLSAAAIVILLGGLVTLGQRLAAAWRELGDAG